MRKFAVVFIFLFSAVFGGCIHDPAKSSAVFVEERVTVEEYAVEPPAKTATRIRTDQPIKGVVVEPPKFAITSAFFDIETPQEPTEELKAIFQVFDIPVTDTPRVQHYMKYFTTNGRGNMQSWINRSNKYMYIVRDIFEKEGIPLDLAMLSFTESGFNPIAYSRAGAAGMWQFMPSTGKIYGLSITEWVDERRDFEKSTLAAARHLKDLYKMFDDWYLALAAYNAGSGRIRKATQKHNSTDFFTIAGSRTLKLETRDYVPKYLAQLFLYKNLYSYGFTPPDETPLLFDTVELGSQANLIVLAQALGSTYEELKMLNPELRTPVTPPTSKYRVRIPFGKGAQLSKLLNDGKFDQLRYTLYQAKAGESLAAIAKRHGISVEDIQKINALSYPKIYSAKLLFLPKKGEKLTSADIQFAKEVQSLSPKYHTVRKGDNLTVISRKYNIPLYVLIRMNPKVNPKKIYPGQVLVISRGGLVG
ncbi:MAG: transglycosylase SLT domain-containing protein [Deferribacteraceae bacterium]|jgi:membrane-bound lytic murein transglycosylase D|nr:transglycosylase SLT domain-containing protein [Deferribacteraceae bacterium]